MTMDVQNGVHTLTVVAIHDNTNQEVITITEDKLNLILIEYEQKIKDKSAWQVPLGLFITIVLVITTTSDFKVTWGIPANYWSAGFHMSGLISFIWFVVAVFKLFSKSMNIKDVIEQAKHKSN